MDLNNVNSAKVDFPGQHTPNNLTEVVGNLTISDKPKFTQRFRHVESFSIKLKKITDTAKVPVRAHDDDTGYDVYADSIAKETERLIMYDTGIQVAPEHPDMDIRIFPRSSVCKRLMVLANSIGLVDNGYRGNLFVVFYKLFPETEPYKVGEKIAQLVPSIRTHVDFQIVNNLSKTIRHDGKLGSTG